ARDVEKPFTEKPLTENAFTERAFSEKAFSEKAFTENVRPHPDEPPIRFEEHDLVHASDAVPVNHSSDGPDNFETTVAKAPVSASADTKSHLLVETPSAWSGDFLLPKKRLKRGTRRMVAVALFVLTLAGTVMGLSYLQEQNADLAEPTYPLIPDAPP